MSNYDSKPKRFKKCCYCHRSQMCYITENDKGDLEFYCEYCHSIVTVKKLKIESRENNDLSFVGNARFITSVKIPNVPWQ